MSELGLDGFRAAAGDFRDVLVSLDDQDWGAPSGAAGWTVKDVAIHVADLLDVLMSAVQGRLDTDLGIEALNEVNVAGKRDRTPAKVLEAFNASVSGALTVFGSLQQEPTASTGAPFLDLGRYPLHMMAELCCFDFFTHLRWDVLAPRGPLTRPVPPADDLRLGACVRWLLAGLPQMQPELPAALTGTVDLRLTGPGGGVWRLRRHNDTIVIDEAAGGPAAEATMTSTTLAFTAWSTTRVPWADVVEVSGDHRVAATFLDAVNLT